MNLNILKQIPGVNKDFKVQVIDHPTKIIIVDDFFIDPFYYYLNSRVIYNLRENAGHQPKNGKDIECSFDIDVYSKNQERDFSNFFISKIWEKSIQNSLNLEINKYTSIFTKYLRPNINRGIYAGPNLCSVFQNEQDEKKDEGLVLVGQDEIYNIDYDAKNLNKIIKSASAVYFCHTKKNEEGSSLEFYEGDITNLKEAIVSLKINAKANRLVLFELTPDSLHRIVNFKNHVGYIQQYFHSNPAYYLNKNLYKIHKTRFKNNLSLFDRHDYSKVIWNIENDSEYKKYFSTLTMQEIFTNFHIRRLLLEKFYIANNKLEDRKEILDDTIIPPAKPLGVFKTKLPEKYIQKLKDLFISELQDNKKFHVAKIYLGQDFEEFILDKIDKYEKMLGYNFYYQKNDPDVVFQSKSAAYVHKKEITKHKKHLNVQKITLWKHDEKNGYQKFTWTDIINHKIACVIYLDVEKDGAPSRFNNLYLHPDKYNTKQHEPGRIDNLGEWLFFSSPTEFKVYTNDIIIYPGAIVHEIGPVKNDKDRLIITIAFD